MKRATRALITTIALSMATTAAAEIPELAPARQNAQLADECRHWVALNADGGSIGKEKAQEHKAAACESYVRGWIDAHNALWFSHGIKLPYESCITEARVDDLIIDFVEMSEGPHMNKELGPANTVANIYLAWVQNKHSQCGSIPDRLE